MLANDMYSSFVFSRLRRKERTENGLHLGCHKCSRYSIVGNAPGLWDWKGFSGADAVHLYKFNSAVKARNAIIHG